MQTHKPVKKKERTIIRSISISSALANSIEAIAETEHRSFSSQVAHFLAAGVSQRETRKA